MSSPTAVSASEVTFGPREVAGGARPVALKRQMLAVSCMALFLEMMVIRWAPSVVPFIAYYANLMLLSSFLGLGVGAMVEQRRGDIFRWFPALLAVQIATLVLCRDVTLGQTAAEARFTTAVGHTVANTLVLIGIFGSNALLFVPLGQRLGSLFHVLPRLSAYGWDLAGSLAGTVAFGLFSLRFFSPLGGLAFVMVVYLALSGRRRWLLDLPVFAAILLLVFLRSDRAAIWSPYHHITVSRIESPWLSESEPPPDLRTMRNPPVYSVKINQFFYHFDADYDLSRYTPGTAAGNFATAWSRYYRFPYQLAQGRDRVLVLGAGGGGDVLGALSEGVKKIDAVDIDPGVIQVARRFNAGAPYADPRVTVHIDDARSFLAKAQPGYDAVVFGFLDSQALFSSMSAVRLDGYVYTVEGIRTAYRLLNEGGMLFLAYYSTQAWLGPKFHQMVVAATGQEPAMYGVERTIIFCVTKNPAAPLPPEVFQFRRFFYMSDAFQAAKATMDLPTDDWPFLYLVRKTIPPDYLIGIGSLLLISFLAILGLRGRSFGAGDLHFGLMGMGFLLLETKSISDCTLYFGATWFVTLVVVAGVLLMVMAANQVAERTASFSFWLYVPLFLSLAVLILVPRGVVLEWAFAGRLLWTLLVVPLPIFFAGLVFSTTFREAASPSAAIGANLIGAMVGGFCEYLAMAMGNHRLAMLVIAAYLGSLLTMQVLRRRGWAV